MSGGARRYPAGAKAERGQPCVQDAGVLVSRRAHGAHHRAPFEGNYCIVSGIWNPVLDQVCAQHGPVKVVNKLLWFPSRLIGRSPQHYNDMAAQSLEPCTEGFGVKRY